MGIPWPMDIIKGLVSPTASSSNNLNLNTSLNL